MKEIHRIKAKELIAETILKKTNCEIPELKVDFPYVDYSEEIQTFLSEGKLANLSEKNIKRIKQENWFDLEFDLVFWPIYKSYLVDTFVYTTNKYLENKLQKLKLNYTVTGEPEPAGKCPCCGYFSIGYGEDGAWEICPVCFWENGGDGPNQMSLIEAQQNFIKFGAMSESALDCVDPEKKIKYRKDNHFIDNK